MRSFWLVSAAFMLSTGIAFAQTSTTSPAPANTMTPPPSTASGQNNMVPPSGSMSHSAGTTHYTGSMPENATAAWYLHTAKVAVSKGNKATAEDALVRAETRMLSRAVPASEANEPINTPGIEAIRNAREAVKAGDMQKASADIDTAMNEIHNNPTYNNGTGSSTALPMGTNQ